MLSYVLLTVFPLLVAFAAASDLVSMTIPNWVSLLLLVTFAVLAPFVPLSFNDILWHCGLSLLVLAIGFTCFAFGWIGGGDAKFAAVLALWFGPDFTPVFLLITSVAGGVITLAFLELRTLPLPQVFARQPWIMKLHEPTTGIPYGLALSFAALAIYAETPFFQAVH